MKFILFIVVLQSNSIEPFSEKFKTLKECKIRREEVLKWNNQVTKVKANCFKRRGNI